MDKALKFPFYAKASLSLIGLFAFISGLYIAQHIIVPIIIATIIAILLNPLVNFFVKKKMNRILSIATTIILVSLVAITFVVLLSSQMSVFIETFPKLLDKFHETLNNTRIWVSNNFNVSIPQINLFIADTKTDILDSSRLAIGSTLSTLGSALVIMFLIPVYVFMILFYKPLLLSFIRRLFDQSNHKEVNAVLISIKNIIQRYLLALLLQAAIIATLNSIGLLIIGIDYAIVLGIIGAFLNFIPYIGAIVSVSLFMMVAFATKSSPSYSLWVLVNYIVIQFIDNHYIIPKIVASKVKINALVSIIVILAGAALWGIPGMLLSIPLTAILKVIFDHIESLKPWGFLLGDTMPVIEKIKTEKEISL